MKKICLLALIGLACSWLPVISWPQAKEEKLETFILVSESPDYIKEWLGSPATQSVKIKTINQVIPEQTFHVAVIVAGFGIDTQGAAHLTGDFKLVGPDGSVVMQDEGIYKLDLKGLQSAPIGLYMLNPVLDITMESKDAPGAYNIKVKVRDTTSNNTADASYIVNLINPAELKPLKKFSSAEALSKWVTYYYIQPEPDKIIEAINYYSESGMINKASSVMPMAAFYAAALKNEPAILNSAFERVSRKGSPQEKDFFLYVLWMLNNTQGKELIEKASGTWKADTKASTFEKISQNKPWDAVNGPIKDPAQLDILWATFLATGDSAPVKRIISVIHLEKDGHGMDMLLGSAASWSLLSNASQHSLVYKICQEEAVYNSGVTKAMLEEILNKTSPENQLSAP